MGLFYARVKMSSPYNKKVRRTVHEYQQRARDCVSNEASVNCYNPLQQQCEEEIDKERLKQYIVECVTPLIPEIPEFPEIPEGITEDRIKELITLCVQVPSRADMKCVVAECLTGINPLTVDQICDIIEGKLSDVPDQLTEAQICSIVESKFPVVAEGISEAQVCNLIDLKVAALPQVPTQADIKNLFNECLAGVNLNPSQLEIKAVIDQCVVLPTNSDIKAIALQCVLENQPDLPTDWSEDQIKLIALRCINENMPVIPELPDIPGAATIKAIAQVCVDNAGILSQSDVKTISEACIQAAAQTPLTATEVKQIAQGCIDQLNPITASTVKTIVETCLESVDVGISSVQAKNIALTCIGEAGILDVDAIKAIVQGCLPEQQCVPTKDEIQAFVKTCIAQLLIKPRTNQEIEALAKAVAKQCIIDSEQLTVNDVKAIFTDCLKDLIPTTGANIQEVIVDAVLTQDCLVDIDVIIDGKVGSAELDLKPIKFTNQDVNIKCQLWTGGYDHANYNPDADCVEIDYKGPTQSDIIAIAQQYGGGVIGGSSVECCNTGLSATLSGTNLNISVSQSGGATVLDSVDLSSLAGGGSSVECCNTGVTVNGDGQGNFTLSITQSNGETVSDTFSIPAGGSSEGCCNTSVSHTLGGNTLTTVVEQSNGASVFDSVELPEYCITGFDVQQAGSIVTLTPQQQNCNPPSFSFVTATGDGTVECCNTGVSLSISNGQLTVSIPQSNGATVSDTVALPASTGGADMSCVVMTDTDGCSQYNSLRANGVEICRLPVYEPMQPRCLGVCIGSSAPFSGVQTVSGFPFPIDIDWGDGAFTPVNANGVATHPYDGFTGRMKICVSSACDNETFEALQTYELDPKHGCC